MQHLKKLTRQSTYESSTSKKIEKSPSEESQQSRSSILEKKLATISVASFPFKKNQIILAKPAIDKNYTVVSSLNDTDVRQISSSIVHELTQEFVDDKLEQDEGFFEFLFGRLIETDMRGIIDLAFEQFPTVFDPKILPQTRERIILLTVKSGRIEILEYFYAKWGNQINFLQITDSDGNTLLQTAVINCNVDTFNVVMEKANELISIQNIEKREEKTKRSINKSESTESYDLTTYINTLNNTGHTAIHLAVNSTFLHGIEVLIQKGADITIPNKENNTPIHSAAIENRAKSLRKVSEILRGISKEGDFTWKEELQRKNGITYTPVMLASDKATIKILLEYYNPDDLVHDEHGSLLHWATANNRTNLVVLLLEHEKIELEKENDRGLTPLCIAARWGYQLMTECLLGAGAKPNYLCTTGMTAMNYACQHGHNEVMEFLLQLGADLNSDEMEYSALHSAINGGQIAISKYLLDVHHMDPNLYKSKGTPLYEAIREGRTPSVKLLLTHGANPQLSLDVHGFRPLHAAIKNNQRQSVKLLLEFGAGADETMHGGVTPSILAVENDHANILALLMNEGISITKIDDLGNTILHHIAMREAYHCAEYLAQHASEYKDWESSIYETQNSQNLTPIDIALAKKEEHILSLFMSLTPGEFFTQNPRIIHELYDQKQYTIVKGIIAKMITSTSPNYVLSTKFLESNTSGQYPTDPKFKNFELTLLHKFRDCPDPEIKYHPILNAVVTEKLRLYNLWYISSFIHYAIFMICLSFSLYYSSIYVCGYQLLYSQGFSSGFEIGRFICDLYILVYGLLFGLSEFFEFFIEWRQTYKDKHLKHELKQSSHIEKWNFREKKQISDVGGVIYLHIFLNALHSILAVDRFTLYFFSNLISFYDAFNAFDALGLIFFFLWVVFRALRFPIQWSCAALAYIAFALSLFKYTRIFPSLGSYVQSIFRIYKIDIPRYAVIIAILLLAFYGGIHLASRQGQISADSFATFDDTSVCNSSEQEFYWIDSQVTGLDTRYEIRFPLIAGFVFLLDGGPSEYQESLGERTILFLVIYFLFAFTIIIVMSNVLIAQLTQTYASITKTDNFHYKIDLVVTFELKSNLSLFFGRHARSLSSFYKMVVPIHTWNQMREESPEKESDLKINEILIKINMGTERQQTSSHKMFHIEDTLETMSMNIQKLTEDVLALQNGRGHQVQQPPTRRMSEIARVPSIQSSGYEKRIDVMEKKLDMILLRITPNI